MARHWSFVVCDKKYLYSTAVLILAFGLWAALSFGKPEHFNRAGNLIIAVGVWMSMRSTLREGINRHKNNRGNNSATNTDDKKKHPPIKVNMREESMIIEGVVVGVLRRGKSHGSGLM